MSTRKVSFPMPRKTEMHTSAPHKSKLFSAEILKETVQDNPESEESDASEVISSINYDNIYVPSCMMESFIDRGILPKRAAKVIVQKFKNQIIDCSPCSIESKLSRIMSERYDNNAKMKTYNNRKEHISTPLSPNENMIIKLGIQHQCFPGFSSLNWSSLYSSAACEHADGQKLVSYQSDALVKARTLGMMRHVTLRNFEELFESGKFSSRVSIAAHITRTENKMYSKSAYFTYSNIVRTNVSFSSASVDLILIALKNFWFDTLEVKIGNSYMHIDRSIFRHYAKAFKDHDNFFLELPSHKVPMHLMAKLYHWMIFDDYKLLFDGDFLPMYNMAKFLDVRVLLNQFWATFAATDCAGLYDQQAFQAYLKARQLQCEDIMTIMLGRIRKFFLPLIASQEYIEFDANEVIFALKLNKIYVNSEDEIFFCALRWLEHDWENRRLFLMDIMSAVRFRLLSPWLHRSILFQPETETIGKLGRWKDIRALLWDACLYAQAQLVFRLSPSKKHDSAVVLKYSRSHIADRSWAYCPEVPHHHDILCPHFRPLTCATFNMFLNLLHKYAQEFMDKLMFVPYKHWHTYRCCKDFDKQRKIALRPPPYQVIKERDL